MVAVGVNCTDPRFIEELLRIGYTVTDKPLVCYPNSGEAWDAVNRCWVKGSTPADFTIWPAVGGWRARGHRQAAAERRPPIYCALQAALASTSIDVNHT